MSKAHLTTGSVNAHLIKLALPALIAIICTFSFIVVDTYFISLLGQNELTAISYATPMIDMIIGVAIGIGIAISSVSARMIGAGDFHKVKTYILHSTIFCLLLSIVISTLGILNINSVFIALGAKGRPLAEIHNFMFVWYIGIFLLIMGFVASNALRANGKAKGPAMVQILMALINLALDPVFMFVLKLDIMGAAIAGLIARTIGFVILMRMLVHYDVIAFNLKENISGIFDSWKKIISISIPACSTNMIGPLATFWITYLLAMTGQAAVAGFGIATKAQMVAVIPLFVLSASIGPVVGQNFSANKPERSFSALKTCAIFAIVWGALISLILIFMAPYISGVFSSDAETITVSNAYMYIVPVSYIGWGVIMMVSANFNSLGHPSRSTLISFTRMIVLFIPLSIILFQHIGYVGVFIAFSVVTLIVAALAYLWAYKDYKRLQASSI